MVHKRDNTNLEIILHLLRGDDHLRNISRSLKIPHSTILRELEQLLKNAALDYKREGKNKIFFIKNTLQAKNYVYNAERYKLIKLLQKYSELNIIINDILKKSKYNLIVLFGSYAKFIAKEYSDIDIYIETKNKKTKEEIETINSKIRVKTGEFTISDLLIKEIIKNHVVLKGVEEFYEKSGFFEQA